MLAYLVKMNCALRPRAPRCRQNHSNSRSLSRSAFDRDLAPGAPHIILHRAQPQPVSPAGGLGGVEQLEQVGLSVRAHAATAVADRELHLLRPGPVASRDHDLSPLGHGIARIEHQIHQNLLHLAGPHGNGIQLAGQPGDQADLLARQTGQQVAGLADMLIPGKPLRLAGLTPRQQEQLLDQSAPLLAGLTDLLGVATQPALRRQFHQHEVRVQQNAGDQVVEVVGHAGHGAPQGLQTGAIVRDGNRRQDICQRHGRALLAAHLNLAQRPPGPAAGPVLRIGRFHSGNRSE